MFVEIPPKLFVSDCMRPVKVVPLGKYSRNFQHYVNAIGGKDFGQEDISVQPAEKSPMTLSSIIFPIIQRMNLPAIAGSCSV